MTLSVRDEPQKHKLRENGHNRLALWFHPGRSDEGETLGTSIRSTGHLGPGVTTRGCRELSRVMERHRILAVEVVT